MCIFILLFWERKRALSVPGDGRQTGTLSNYPALDMVGGRPQAPGEGCRGFLTDKTPQEPHLLVQNTNFNLWGRFEGQEPEALGGSPPSASPTAFGNLRNHSGGSAERGRSATAPRGLSQLCSFPSALGSFRGATSCVPPAASGISAGALRLFPPRRFGCSSSSFGYFRQQLRLFPPTASGGLGPPRSR